MPSVVDRFCRFLDRAEWSLLTRRNYRSDLEGLATWFEGQNGRRFSPDQITSTDLREYKRWLAGQALKPATINRKLASLRCFLHWAVDVRLLRSGHGLRIPKPVREQRRGPRWLDRREQHRLVRAVERAGKSRDIAAILLMLNTGLRVAEMCALVWKDIRVTDRHGTLTVRKGKGSKRREIPLNKDARRVLLSLGYGEHAGAATSVLVGQRGPLTPRGFQILAHAIRPGSGSQRRDAALTSTQLL
jgi:integrase/recombinase XerC